MSGELRSVRKLCVAVRRGADTVTFSLETHLLWRSPGIICRESFFILIIRIVLLCISFFVFLCIVLIDFLPCRRYIDASLGNRLLFVQRERRQNQKI